MYELTTSYGCVVRYDDLGKAIDSVYDYINMLMKTQIEGIYSVDVGSDEEHIWKLRTEHDGKMIEFKIHRAGKRKLSTDEQGNRMRKSCKSL